MGPENVGQDVTGAAANVQHLSEAPKRKAGSDPRTFGAIDALHESRHRLAPFGIRSNVLEERLSVDSREYRLASLQARDPTIAARSKRYRERKRSASTPAK
jgi:hypothetical protein